MREHFLVPTDRLRHIAVSALDASWMDAVDPSLGVFVIAQGLFMYLEPEAVRQILSGIADRFEGAEIVFDAVPRWFSRWTMRGVQQTPHYRLPPMPWGINRDELASTLQCWHPRLADAVFLDYRPPRGMPLFLALTVHQIPVARQEIPSLVQITVAMTTAQRSDF